jgi:hypothetical protein
LLAARELQQEIVKQRLGTVEEGRQEAESSSSEPRKGASMFSASVASRSKWQYNSGYDGTVIMTIERIKRKP